MAEKDVVVVEGVLVGTIEILAKSQNFTKSLSPIGSILDFNKNATLLISMLRTTNSSENLLLSLDMSKKDKVVSGSAIDGTIQILSKSQKPPKFGKG